MSLSDDYADLLIMQYAGKPKARAEIKAYADEFEMIYDFALSWFNELDLDKAWGQRLDIIGKIVGIDRIVERGYIKPYFGFADDPTAKTFGIAPMFDLAKDSGYAATELDDDQYRFFIKSKVAKNITAAVMASDGERQSIQDTVQFLFSGHAYVDDNKGMTLSLYIDDTYDLDQLRIILAENLLPSPQGVGYKEVIQYFEEGTFGFAHNADAVGFGQGRFAQLVDIR